MKRKVLRFIDFAAIMTLLIGASAADWSPIGIVAAMILIPCGYIGLRQWAERSMNERN